MLRTLKNINTSVISVDILRTDYDLINRSDNKKLRDR